MCSMACQNIQNLIAFKYELCYKKKSHLYFDPKLFVQILDG